MSVEVRGVGETRDALDALSARVLTATRAALAQIAHRAERAAKEKLTEKSHPAGTPTPSLPGEPPALVTGHLRRSIVVDGPRSAGPGPFRGWLAQIGPTTVYGRIQELGGHAGAGHRTYLPARPYLRPGWHLVQPNARSIVVDAVANAIRKG